MSNKKQLQQMSQFSIIRESPGDKHLTNNNKKSNHSNHTREIKFKYEEPIGIRPEDDDDLETCPARTRASWPHQIVPWWKPTDRYEKPPYSYATLIAHAILTSKNGRLTLSDIYKWISEAYPYYKRGQKGWQVNSKHSPHGKHSAHHPSYSLELYPPQSLAEQKVVCQGRPSPYPSTSWQRRLLDAPSQH